MMETAIDRQHHILGVLEHGMYLKRMCEHGRPLQIFKEEVSTNKCKSEEVEMS